MILAVIPARGGSKGVPRKNVKMIAGKPLIVWSIEAARRSTLVDRIVVSTEDSEIKEISIHAGAEVVDRPSRLADDNATTVSVIQHVLTVIDADTLVILQPTSPYRSPGLVDRCIQRFIDTGADTLATGYTCKIVEYGTHANLRRQDIRGFFYDDGNVYVHKSEVLRQGRWSGDKIEPYFTEKPETYEIDDHFDFWLLEQVLLHYAK